MSLPSIVNFKNMRDFQSNTNISLVNNYVYMAVDKVANSTIKRCLYEVEYIPVGWKVSSLYDPRNSPLLHPFQIPIKQLNDILFSDKSFKFCFVRNPYSRLVSCYLDRILTLSTRPSRQFREALGKNEFCFNDFLKTICLQESNEQNSHWRVQSDDVLYDLIDFDYVAYFENLNLEMEFLSKKIFGKVFPQMIDLNINSSPKKTGSDDKVFEFYDQYHADMVYERYKKDFENFGYKRLMIK